VGHLSVVSTEPGTLLGAPKGEELLATGINPGSPNFGSHTLLPGSYPVALVGRVPVKVSLENGPIQAGNLLTSASKTGYAMKATRSGSVIGTALESFIPSEDSDVEEGFIEVFVSPYYRISPEDYSELQARLETQQEQLEVQANELASLKEQVELVKALLTRDSAVQLAAVDSAE
jgi:hypothetical protein